MTNIIIKSVNEASRIASLKMTAGDNYVVRISGGCGSMDASTEAHLLSFATAFTGFKGVILIGGTRMVYRCDLSKIRIGVTELAPAIKKVAPESTTIGIVPKIKGQDLQLMTIPDTVLPFIAFGQEEEFVTTFNADNDFHIMVQNTADLGVRWEDEYLTALNEMDALKREKNYKIATLFYNGGKVSEQEMLDTIKLGWPVILIKNSGRMCDTYGNDTNFLTKHPNVFLVETPEELGTIMQKLLLTNH